MIIRHTWFGIFCVKETSAQQHKNLKSYSIIKLTFSRLKSPKFQLFSKYLSRNNLWIICQSTLISLENSYNSIRGNITLPIFKSRQSHWNKQIKVKQNCFFGFFLGGLFQKKDDNFLFSFKENNSDANFGHTRIINSPRKKPAALKPELLQNAT